MGPQVSLSLGPSLAPDHPLQGPDCALKPDWDSGPRTELALGSVVRGGEEGPPHRSCDVCLSISPWSLTVEGPASRGQPESKAACPGWPEPSWDVPHFWLLDDQTAGRLGPPCRGRAQWRGGVSGSEVMVTDLGPTLGQGSAAPSTRRCPARLFPGGWLTVPEILREKLLTCQPVGAEPSSAAPSKGAGNLYSCLSSRWSGYFRFRGLTKFSPTRQSPCP